MRVLMFTQNSGLDLLIFGKWVQRPLTKYSLDARLDLNIFKQTLIKLQQQIIICI